MQINLNQRSGTSERKFTKLRLWSVEVRGRREMSKKHDKLQKLLLIMPDRSCTKQSRTLPSPQQCLCCGFYSFGNHLLNNDWKIFKIYSTFSKYSWLKANSISSWFDRIKKLNRPITSPCFLLVLFYFHRKLRYSIIFLPFHYINSKRHSIKRYLKGNFHNLFT